MQNKSDVSYDNSKRNEIIRNEIFQKMSEENAEYARKSQEVDILNERINSLERYKSFYEDILKSSSWKLTAPIRKLTNIIKHQDESEPYLEKKSNSLYIKPEIEKAEIEKPKIDTASNRIEVLKKKLENFDVVSFDIFDTLLTRRVYKPDDLFFIIQKKIEFKFHIEIDFLKVRKSAERQAWKKKGAYCNIHHIYKELQYLTNFSGTQIDEIKELEVKLEMSLCIPRWDMLELFNSVIRSGKPVYLISDMYLTKEIIEDLLKQSGYAGYRDILISCEIGCRKDDGTLWNYYFEQIKGKTSIHLGDNEISDVSKVQELGKEAILIPSAMTEFSASSYYKKYEEFIDTTMENSLILGRLVNEYIYNSPFTLNDDIHIDTIDKLGETFFAPLILLFSKFIHDNSADNGKLLFLSREGYLLQKSYKEYCSSFKLHELENYYFLTSRRASSVARLHTYDHIKENLKAYYSGKLSALLKERFALDIQIDDDRDVTLPFDESIVLMKIADHLTEILENADEENQAYCRYINQLLGEKFDWSAAKLIDVGYAGSIQAYLIQLLDYKLDGIYLIKGNVFKPEALGGSCSHIYSFADSEIFSECYMFLEAALTAPYGQLVKFELAKEIANPIYKVEECNYLHIKPLQDAIIEYIHTMGNILEGCNCNFDKKLCEKIFGDLLVPDIITSEVALDLKVNDDWCLGKTFVYDGKQAQWQI